MAINVAVAAVWDSRKLQDAQRDIEGFKSKAGKAFDGLADVGKKVAIGVGAAAVAGVALGSKLIQASEAASTSNDRIRQISESMGLFEGNTEEATRRIIDLAEATARATGIDANQIKATQAKLLTFAELADTADEAGGAFDRATAAAIDLAAAGFGSAESNATALGKALNDPIAGISALARSGVSFNDVERERIQTLVDSNRIGEAQAIILEAIETQVGGTAAATANGSDRMREAFRQLQARLGDKLAPVFERFVNFVIDKLVPLLERLAEKIIPKVTGVFEKLQETLGPIVTEMRERLEPIIRTIVEYLKENTEIVRNFFIVLGGVAVLALLAALATAVGALFTPFVLILGAILLVTIAVTLLWKESETFRDIVTDVWDVLGPYLKEQFDKFTEGLREIIRFIEALGRAFIKVFEGDIPGAIDEFAEIDWFKLFGFANLLSLPARIVEQVKLAFEFLGTESGEAFRRGVQKAATSISDFFIGGGTSGLARRVFGSGFSALRGLVPFAKGGIVTGPTAALIGEAGPEAVIPLDKLGRLGGVTINVSGALDPVAVAEQIRTILARDSARLGIGAFA